MEANTFKSNQRPLQRPYKQMIVVSIKENGTLSSDDTFPASFLNIFVDYPLGEMKIGNKSWTNWNKAPLKLWQTQLNFAVCGVHQVLVGSVLSI